MSFQGKHPLQLGGEGEGGRVKNFRKNLAGGGIRKFNFGGGGCGGDGGGGGGGGGVT